MHNLTNRVFGRLTVTSKSKRRTGNRLYWDCECSCEKLHSATTDKLLSGNTQSCGCLAQESRGKANITHGCTRGPRSGWDARFKMLYAAKNRAKKNGLPFSLRAEDIVIPERCPVFGFRLFVNSLARFDSPSLDRIICNKGYVVGNIQVISHRANTIKNDASVDELKSVVAFLESR